MQDRYVGDIGDFIKYALLRAIIGYPSKPKPHFSLGIIWYKTDPKNLPGESRKHDGKKINYLKNTSSEFSKLDSKLFEALFSIVDKNQRTTSAVEKSSIFPKDTVFFDKLLNGVKGFESNRDKWFSRARGKTINRDIVFIDPDNGILPKSLSKTESKAVKYVLFEELAAFSRKKQSLIIYHHLGRNGTHKNQIKEKLKSLREVLPNYLEICALFGIYRAYFIAIPPSQKEKILKRVENFLKLWKEHFKDKHVLNLDRPLSGHKQ